MLIKTGTLNQAGDTIVEVLIAVVVVSVVLVGAYTISNASLRQIRMSQERTEAQKIAVGELEKFTKCDPIPTPPPVPTSGPNYTVTYSCAADTNTFTTTVKWDGLNGLPQEVSMYYRGAP
ncbi:MAG: prepilin-type N-terminal cleavage/methylation domain-containing protein [Candidatus Saccharibacteria bacterium]